MIIEYKKPYWIKYSYGIKNNEDYEISKDEPSDLLNCIYSENFSIICEFSIGPNYTKDMCAGVFGKSGMNYGLVYMSAIDKLVFEFWTKKSGSTKLNNFVIDGVDFKYLNGGIILIIIKKDKTMYFYDGDILLGEFELGDDELIDDYKDQPFYLGAVNPGADNPEHRYYSQVNIKYFTIVDVHTDINLLNKIHQTPIYKMYGEEYYNDIYCLYNFRNTNINKMIYDESKNSNYLELVPDYFVI